MKKKKLEFTITVATHIAAAVVSPMLAIAVLLAYHKLTPEFMATNTFVTAIFPVVIAECFTMFMTMYDGKYAFSKSSWLSSACRCFITTFLMSGIWAIILLVQKNEVSLSRYFFVSTASIHFVLLTVSYKLIQDYVIRRYYKTNSASIVMLITTSDRAAIVSDLLKRDWSRNIRAIALLDEECCPISGGESYTDKLEIDHIPVVAGRQDLVEWVQHNAVDEAFFFVSDNNAEHVMDAMQALVKMGLSVHLSLPTVEELNRSIRSADSSYYPYIVKSLGFFMDKIPMVNYNPPQPKMRYMIIKRLTDIAGGAVGCAITLILYCILGIAIKLDSPGPILFSQERVGKNGRIFKIYKFRSMYIDAEERKKTLMKDNEMDGLMFKMKDDPRITKVGKFIRKTSLDEFPQFFNVLKGEMSLVGTRPPTVSEFKEYSDHHKRRLAMKPGITGMWQVSGRSEIKSFEDVVKLDCKYIDNWSIWLDISILIKTVGVVLTGRGSE